MNTLAKAKAQALVQPPKPLAVTPNVRQFNSPAAGAALSLSNEATNIVQVVNPASTLTINVDGQNFSAFGANHFVLHVDTTASTEITLNFVRGATVLATKSIEIEADQLAVLTFAAVIKANNAVTLLALGNHVVGKSEATDGNGAVGGLLLVPTGATESTDGIYQRFTYDGLRVTYIDLMGEEGNPARYGWSAELPVNRIGNALAVTLKMPDLSGNKSANVFIADHTAEEITSGLLSREIFGGTSGYNYISLELRPDQSGVTLNVHNAADPFNPVALPLNNNVLDGDPIAINLVGSNVIVEHAGSSQTLTLPSGFFSEAGLPNVVACSFGETVADSAAMSIKVLVMDIA